jgi:hypothetical protein
MDRYDNDSSVIIAEINCEEYEKTCLDLISRKGAPSFALFKKGRASVITPERSLSSFTDIVEELKAIDLTIPCFRYPVEFDGEYPSFIYGSSTLSDSEVCNTLQQIARFLHGHGHALYYESGSPQPHYTVLLNDSITVDFKGQFDFPALARFTRDYSMMPFGFWRVDEAPMTARRFAFVIYDNRSTLDLLRPVAYDYIRDFVIGSHHLEHFKEQHPEIQIDVPAVFVLNQKKSGFLLRQQVSGQAEFAELLQRIKGGKLEKEMTLLLPKLFPKIVRNTEGVVLEPVARPKWRIFVLVGIVVIIITFGVPRGKFTVTKDE